MEPGIDEGFELRESPSNDKEAVCISMHHVFDAIEAERKFQDEKHGHPSKNPHSIGAWILIAEKELEEAKTACIKGAPGRDNVINELVQVAATIVACLQQHGVAELPGRTV